MEFLQNIPSLDTAIYIVTITAKAYSVDPTLALLTVGCAVVLLLSILVHKVARLVLFLSAGIKWICFLVAILLVGLFVIIGVQRLWIVPEVALMRCRLVSFLEGIEGGRGWVSSVLGGWLCPA